MTNPNNPQSSLTLLIKLDDGTTTDCRASDFLGRGALADVYKTSDGKRVAKIPRDGSARLAEFEQEKDLLTFLNTTKHVPPIQTGNVIIDGLKLPVIIMPYYDKSLQLSEQMSQWLSKRDYLQVERQLMPSLIAFCDVMIRLHTYRDQAGKSYTCVDRKSKDFYLVGNTPIIIDWNVLSEDTPDFRQAEIRIFGTLIHELYFGSKGKFPYEPLNDRRWLLPNSDERGVVSVGLRYILARMVQRPSYYAQGTDDYFVRLKEHLVAWQHVLQGQTQYLDKLAIENELYRNAIDKDISWRLNKIDAKSRDEVVIKAFISTLTPSEYLLKTITDKLNLNREDAYKFVEAYSVPNTLDEITKNILQAHLERWRLLLKYQDEKFDLRRRAEIRSQLIPQIGGTLHTEKPLEANQIELARKSLERLVELLPEKKADLEPIEYEIALHEQLEAFHHALSLEDRAELLRKINWQKEKTPHLNDDFLNHILDGYIVQQLYDELSQKEKAIDINTLTRTYHDLALAARLTGWDEPLKKHFDMLHRAVGFLNAYRLFLDDSREVSMDDLQANYNLLNEGIACLNQLKNTRLNDVFKPHIQKICKRYDQKARRYLEDFLNRPTTIPMRELFRAIPLVEGLRPYFQSPKDAELIQKFDELVKYNVEFIIHLQDATTTEGTISPELAGQIIQLLKSPQVDLSLLTISSRS